LVPRARPFTRKHIAKRRTAAGLTTDTLAIGNSCTPQDEAAIAAVIAALVKTGGVDPATVDGADPAKQADHAYKLNIAMLVYMLKIAHLAYTLKSAITSYRVRLLACRQERPAVRVAALNMVLKAAMALHCKITARAKRNLLTRLAELPDSLRFDLRAGGLEPMLTMRGTAEGLNVALTELIERGIARQCYWRRKIRKGAPIGSAAMGKAFREHVLMILDEHCPDVPEAKRRKWAGDVWDKIGDAKLDPKKHAARFKGRFVARKNAR
jgi:hypothetical protein